MSMEKRMLSWIPMLFSGIPATESVHFFLLPLALSAPLVKRETCKRKSLNFVQNIKNKLDWLFIIDFSANYRYYLIINGL